MSGASRQSYILDTSALLAFYEDEPGCEMVESVFEARERGEAEIGISFMSIFEVMYLAMACRGDEEAFSLLLKIRSLGMEEIWPDEDLVWIAAGIKAKGGLSVADAFVAASAEVRDAVLLHRDPEFERLSSKIKTLPLPRFPST